MGSKTRGSSVEGRGRRGAPARASADERREEVATATAPSRRQAVDPPAVFFAASRKIAATLRARTSSRCAPRRFFAVPRGVVRRGTMEQSSDEKRFCGCGRGGRPARDAGGGVLGHDAAGEQDMHARGDGHDHLAARASMASTGELHPSTGEMRGLSVAHERVWSAERGSAYDRKMMSSSKRFRALSVFSRVFFTRKETRRVTRTRTRLEVLRRDVSRAAVRVPCRCRTRRPRKSLRRDVASGEGRVRAKKKKKRRRRGTRERRVCRGHRDDAGARGARTHEDFVVVALEGVARRLGAEALAGREDVRLVHERLGRGCGGARGCRSTPSVVQHERRRRCWFGDATCSSFPRSRVGRRPSGAAREDARTRGAREEGCAGPKA